MKLSLPFFCAFAACADVTVTAGAPDSAASDAAVITPSSGARIVVPATGRQVSEQEMLADLMQHPLIMFGELHNTPKVQALEAWLLDAMLARNPSLNLAMEHFDRDVQPVIDSYFAGEIDRDTFLAKSRPWKGFDTAWEPLINTIKAANRSLVALNVPRGVLNGVYGEFPTMPLEVLPTLSPELLAFLPPLPLAPYSAEYAAYFEASFDFEAHQLGLDYPTALQYFTELAVVRDETMANRLNIYLHESNEQVLALFGAWHVERGIATPARVNGDRRIISTLPEGAELKDANVADYVLIYKAD